MQNSNQCTQFQNHALFCIGTGRMGLALQKEYQDQLRLVQREIGFSHIRGHGLFCDDMAIYQCHQDENGAEHTEYNFTYLDRVMDSYLENGLRPFLELGFMPKKMARGEQTIFYWQGNTTPPADYDKWAALIRATIAHLIGRYGREEVAAWPVEVWNEPNLPGFWENADQQEYLRLYDVSARAVKEALPEMRVGGPAVCGGGSCIPWLRAFLEHCRDTGAPLDFVTRHIYMGQQPSHEGRYLYQAMCDPAYSIHEAEESRELIDSFPEFRGMELHITEFNTSYNPFCPTHDTVYNAALIAGMLARLGDTCASYSYWTFGDVFEEQGVPARPFHGGFGLVADGLIKKPTYWTFRFFKDMQGELLYRDENCVAIRAADGSLRVIAWNTQAEEKEYALSLPAEDGEWTAVFQTVDENHANPLKLWHDLGEPASLTAEQLSLLRAAAVPGTESWILTAEKHTLNLHLSLGKCAVQAVCLTKRTTETERGYRYPGIGLPDKEDKQ